MGGSVRINALHVTWTRSRLLVQLNGFVHTRLSLVAHSNLGVRMLGTGEP